MIKSSDHRTWGFHDSMSEQRPQLVPELVPESSQGSEENDENCDATTDFPEIFLGLGRVDDAGKVHAVIGREEREGEKYNSYNGEDEDSFILAVRDYR